MENFQEYSNLISQRAQFYREENAKFEQMFSKMKIFGDDLNLLQLRNYLEKISSSTHDLFDSSNIDEFARSRKHNHYLSILKMCIKYYINLNNVLSSEVQAMKTKVDQSGKNITKALTLSSQDAQQLKEKARKYEEELLKFEKKYPWVSKTDYNFQNINNLVEKLRALKEEKESLDNEISRYHNLKPDIKEARQQLADLKMEMSSTMKYLKV